LTVEQLLERLQTLDIHISLEGDHLKCSAPKGVFTREIGRDIEERKPEIIRLLRESSATAPELLHDTTESSAPLSYGQERLWFLQKLEPGSTAYNLTAHLRLRARVERVAFEYALRQLLLRHAILHTTFPEMNGHCVQVVQDLAELPLVHLDLSGVPQEELASTIDRTVGEHSKKAFDLTKDLPLRVAFVHIGDEDCLVIVTMHHIIADEWSFEVFFRDLRELYVGQLGESANLPELRVQYADFARWQRETARSEFYEAQVRYWIQKLKNAPSTLDLPYDSRSKTIPSFEGQVHDFHLGAESSHAVKQLARQEGVTLFMALLAVFKALLFRYTGETDVVVATPVSLRSRPELEPMIGFFANTLVLRTGLGRGITARQLLRDVRETVLEAHANKDVTFERLVRELNPERSVSGSPIAQVAFVLQTSGPRAEYEMASAGAIFDLTMYVRDVGGRISGSIEYRTSLFRADTMERFSNHFCRLASEMAAHPEKPVASLPMLSAEETGQLISRWSGEETDYPRQSCIHELFAETARTYPDRIALQMANADSSGPERSLTYAQLDKLSNQFARRLRDSGADSGTRVGICLERGVEAIVAILATVKAGAAYVPLDPTYPLHRLEFMLQDAGLQVLVTKDTRPSQFANFQGKRIDLTPHDWTSLEASDATPLPAKVDAKNLAYLMYTSGSTGMPKGTAIPHRAVVRLVRNTNYLNFGPEESFLACAPISFDASTLEIWGSLLNGGRLVLFTEPVPTPKKLARAIRDFHITTLWLTSGLFHQMVDNEPNALATVPQVLAGGDVLSVKHVNKLRELLRPDGVLINGYGPTENTTFTCCYRIAKHGPPLEESVPIGKPIANTTVYVLDQDMRPVPIGTKGELFVGGDGLAAGYWNRPGLTAEKFVPDPFSRHPDARLYRTGDIVRFSPEGDIQFFGRRDNQVKIRGFRIELEEVEEAVSRHPGVHTCAVLARPDTSGSKTLVCYYVPKNEALKPEEFRSFLVESLPAHAIPSIYVPMENLPLTAVGKVDRSALRPVERFISDSVPPRTPLETQLAAIWENVLGVSDIGVTDNFFDLGGHSLLAVQMFAQLEKIFDILPLALLFQAPTIEQMAAKLSGEGIEMPWRSLVAIQTEGTKPPLFFVPGIGGNVLGYADLARHLGTDQPIYGLQSLGLNGEQTPLENIEEIAASFLREIRTVQPKGPYYLGGACMGGVVALEMAQQLRQQGESVRFLTMIETWPPENVAFLPALAQRATGPAKVFLRRLGKVIRHFLRPGAADDGPGLRAKAAALREMYRQRQSSTSSRLEQFREQVTNANYRAIKRYRPRPYAGPILIFLASKRVVESQEDPRLSWAKLATGECPVIRIGAVDSGWILKEPHVASLAHGIKQALGEGLSSPKSSAA
jgi:amino acid adenylation domain-containing protein